MAMAVTSLLPSSSHFSSCPLLSMPSHRALDKLFGIHYGGRLWKKALSTSATYSQTRDFSARLQDRIDKLPELVQDIFQTSIKTGPRGAIRLVQGIQAVMDVGGEWLLDVSKTKDLNVRDSHLLDDMEQVKEQAEVMDRKLENIKSHYKNLTKYIKELQQIILQDASSYLAGTPEEEKSSQNHARWGAKKSLKKPMVAASH